MQFPCKGCGECCRHVNGQDALDRGDGTCRYYDDASRQCTVYETRPLACNVDQGFSLFFESRISATAFYMSQALACTALHADNHDMPERTENALREAGRYDEKERVDIETMQRVSALVQEKMTDANFQLSAQADVPVG